MARVRADRKDICDIRRLPLKRSSAWEVLAGSAWLEDEQPILADPFTVWLFARVGRITLAICSRDARSRRPSGGSEVGGDHQRAIAEIEALGAEVMPDHGLTLTLTRTLTLASWPWP